MTLGKEQAQALTRLVHLLRPAWSEEGIYAALAKCQPLDAYDVALAAIRAAQDSKVRTPGVIPTRGSHWNELEPTAPKVRMLPRIERRNRTCDTCGATDGCRPPAHEFVPLDHATRDRTPAGIAAVRAELAQAKEQAHG